MEYKGWNISVWHGESGSLFYCADEQGEIQHTAHSMAEARSFIDSEAPPPAVCIDIHDSGPHYSDRNPW